MAFGIDFGDAPEEEDVFDPEEAAYETVVDMVLEKYPEANYRRGTLADIPVGKYGKLCYAVIEDEYQDFIVRGFMIAAIDKATHSDVIIYRSNER